MGHVEVFLCVVALLMYSKTILNAAIVWLRWGC